MSGLLNVGFQLVVPGGGAVLALSNPAANTQISLVRVEFSHDATGADVRIARGTSIAALTAFPMFMVTTANFLNICTFADPTANASGAAGSPFAPGEGMYFTAPAGTNITGHVNYKLIAL